MTALILNRWLGVCFRHDSLSVEDTLSLEQKGVRSHYIRQGREEGEQLLRMDEKW